MELGNIWNDVQEQARVRDATRSKTRRYKGQGTGIDVNIGQKAD